MEILHVSDTHGSFPALLPYGDVIVHSGDLFPNRSFANAAVEVPFQTSWLIAQAENVRRWLGSRKLLYVPGNHDYVDPAPILREVGVDVTTLVEASLELEGIWFYGFPWTNSFCGWNWMCSPQEMAAKIRPAVELIEAGRVDVFVCHGPMYGVLDGNREGIHCGSEVLRDVFRIVSRLPGLYLHGHIHEASGLSQWHRGSEMMLVSNAACVQTVVKVSPR